MNKKIATLKNYELDCEFMYEMTMKWNDYEFIYEFWYEMHYEKTYEIMIWIVYEMPALSLI